MPEKKKEKAWYIAQTYSGKEDLVRTNLKNRVISYDLEDQILQIVVPEQTIQEKKEDGTIKEKTTKIFPSYIFVEMIDNDRTWWVVRNTPGVTGILGSSGNKERPIPMSQDEINEVLKRVGLLKAPTVAYKVGDQITVISGSYKDFTGTVESIDMDKNEVVVLLEMFNREVEVSLRTEEVAVEE